jgi:hypothetical protein
LLKTHLPTILLFLGLIRFDSAITIAIFSMTCRVVNRIPQEIYLQTTTSEPLTKKQKFVKIAKYSGIAFGVIFALTVLSAIIFGPGSSFNRIGFYILFIPLWILASIGVFKLLFLFIRILLIVMGVLCLIGFLLIISGERTLEGILTLSPVGFFVAFILGIVFSTFLISLLTGLLAGLFVGGFISDKIDSALGLICGLGVLNSCYRSSVSVYLEMDYTFFGWFFNKSLFRANNILFC